MSRYEDYVQHAKDSAAAAKLPSTTSAQVYALLAIAEAIRELKEES